MEVLGSKNFCYNKMMWLQPNSFYAGLLQDLYAGDSGEIVSFLQYSYQSFVLMPFGEDFGKIFERLANEEFLIAKKLAEAIVMLGGNPIFANLQGKYLGGRAVSQTKDIKGMLVDDIELKEKSLINFKTILLKIDNQYLKNLINSIIKEKEFQLATLKAYLESLKDEPADAGV
ncbi:MAG: ferritin-like domain-containing protein [Clostridia bacterium]|nr:ferritin-like domain-containing protein [Clostridia bacterium]